LGAGWERGGCRSPYRLIQPSFPFIAGDLHGPALLAFGGQAMGGAAIGLPSDTLAKEASLAKQ